MKRVTLYAVLFVCLALAPRVVFAHDIGCGPGVSVDQCALLQSAQPRSFRPHSDTCVHFPFIRRSAGPIDFFALDFRFTIPPRTMTKQQAAAFIAEQTARAHFSDHKVTGPADDFCEIPAKIGHPVSVVFCDADGFGYLRGETLEDTLRARIPPNGLRVPLYGIDYRPGAAAAPGYYR